MIVWPLFWQRMVEIAAWSVAAAWCERASDAMRNLGSVPDLTSVEWDRWPEGEAPSLTVVVPAKDEAKNIEATLDALLMADYAPLLVACVNDRSEDETGMLMDRYAARHPDRIGVLHVLDLPPGWLGKTHAMQRALDASESEWVLFTDADVLFSPSILRRSIAYAQSVQADHLVVMPTMQIRSWGEGMVLGFFQTFGLWATRPWKVADPKASRDVIGVGAFNLVRRSALAEVGGLAPQRMAVLEDVTLGRRMKAAGKRQRVAFAPGLVVVHWAKGASGLVAVMSKNLFSAFNFRAPLAFGACIWLVLFGVLPFAGLFWWWTILPALLVMACVATVYRLFEAWSGIPARYGWTYPLGALLFCWAILRSVALVWKDRGVKWRGTLYPLRELRRHNSPFQWSRAGRGRHE